MIKEIEKTIKETRRFCDICESEMTYHCIKIDFESNASQVDYPNVRSETFDICVRCMLKKVFPLIEKEFGIKPTYISEYDK
jgi:hypothetical protein